VLEIVIIAAVLVGLLIALGVFRLGSAVASLAYFQSEIAEAIWATTGLTASEWRKRKSEARLNEYEQKSWEKFQAKQK
jgi:hypothetical protein